MNQYIFDRIGTHYHYQIKSAFSRDADTASEMLEMALGDESLKPYQQWMLLFALSANTQTAVPDMLKIISYAQQHLSYRPILRNVIRNPSTPPSLFASIDLCVDPLMKSMVEKRLASK